MSIFVGVFFLIGGILLAKRGRGGNMSFVAGISIIIGVYLVGLWIF